ncbi:hypothetical protein GDO81_004827 [Engystomops pustulosus]|uniref:G-protein coupled receptors family 1 profile domain-containing protein n=1 Tax=Engystomops pustulosus TaxID=76066 RepID=A0AAV7CJI5_ENGPU|nr:hypothetical protein GDO81_004827 [Engystomops pustulosus]
MLDSIEGVKPPQGGSEGNKQHKTSYFAYRRLEDSLLIMYVQVMFIFLAAVGLPVNFLLVYIFCFSTVKVAASDIFFIHLSIANLLQLITRIPTLIVPYQDNFCYPMSIPCKFFLFILFCSRKASMWITLLLDVFHLVKLTNKERFLSLIHLKKSCVQLCLALNWFIWVAAGVPYPLLIPSDRPRQNTVHMNATCFCSLFDVLTEKDFFLKTYDMVFGTVLQGLAIILMCLVDVKVLWILRKHQLVIVSHDMSQGQRSHHREVTAIKVITSLVVFFVICHLIDALLRNYSNEFVDHIRRLIEHLYPVVSPFILGFGDKRFRKRIKCIMFCRPCKTTNVSEVMTVS